MFVSATTTILALVCAQAPGSQDSAPKPQRLEQRANEFTQSSQDSAALDAREDGSTVMVWHSRRQQSGTYGVYARAFGPDGAARTGEVQVNANTKGMQMQPAVAMGDQDGVWFAWQSYGADGEQGAIIARRFAGDLSSATSEVLVNEQTAGNQSEPLIAALPGGGALVVWLSPDEKGEHLRVRARRLGADGAPTGPAFAVDASPGTTHRTPTLVTDSHGQALVVYARVDADAKPAGIFARQMNKDGEFLEGERRLDSEDQPGLEPTIGIDDGELTRGLAAWLVADGDDYAIRTRGLSWLDDELTLSTIQSVPVEGEGYTSGLSVSVSDKNQGILSWSRYADGPKREAGLFASRLSNAGAPQGKSFRVTETSAGSQSLASARGTQRTHLTADGRMAFAWSGQAGLGDKSGAHLTLLAPDSTELVAAASSNELSFAPLDEGARPHDPPVFDPEDVVQQGSGGDTESAGGASFDFLGFTSTGWTPPDPEMAVGMNHIVGMVNGGIAWWTKDGTQEFFQDINGGGGFWGSQGASSFVFDPEVVWDSHSDRFVVFASDANNGYLLAVSDDGDPNGAWHKYLIDTIPIHGTDFIDSGNLAVDEDVITITGDDFGPDRLYMLFIDKSTAMSGAPLVFDSATINGRQSMGTTTNYDGGNQPLYLVWADEFTTSTSLRIYAVTNRLTNPTTQFVTVTVPSYSHPNDPPQMGTSSRPELFEARFWSAVVRDGQLWATHHQGQQRARVRWYQFDLAGWPSSGASPSLVQTGDINLGQGIFTFFPSIWVDAAQNMAISFAQSSSNEFISMNMAFRKATDPLGTTQTPLRIRDSLSPEGSGRWGDYSATNDDPAQADSFWGIHEYRNNSSWRTRIARIDIGCLDVPQNYCTGAPNSAGPGASISATGSTSILANDLVLTATGCPQNQFGIFFYGPSQTQVVLGDGFRCVDGSLYRLPAVDTGVFGIGSYALDHGNLPLGGDIAVGSTWNFQFWFRDPPFGGAGYNTSDALQITFCD
ncbi:MAG: hypothetical protein ACI8QC_004302 [Planctomycetota bacterium]|jgi:hypothetical protein